MADNKATESGDASGTGTVQITIQNLTSPHEEDHKGVTINGEAVR